MSNIDQLTGVSGIGQSKAEDLLKQFGSLEAITSSSVSRLTSVDGIGATTAKRLLALDGRTTQPSGSPSNDSGPSAPTYEHLDSEPDKEVQNLLDSLENTQSIEELGNLAGRARELANDDSTIAIRNPQFVETLSQIYQREEDVYTKEEYDRVYVLRYTAWAIAACVEHRPQPILDRLETPLSLIRDTTVSKNIRISAKNILTNLCDEHPELLINELEDHHGEVREGIRFRHPDQESNNAATTAARLIDLYTANRGTGPYEDVAPSLIDIIDDDAAYRAVERIAGEAPRSIIEHTNAIDDKMTDAENTVATRLIDVLATAADAASGDLTPLTDVIELRPEYTPTLRQKIIDVYASVAAQASNPIDMSLETFDELASDDDWQVRKQAVQLVAAADIEEDSRSKLFDRLNDDPMPAVAEAAAEAQEK